MRPSFILSAISALLLVTVTTALPINFSDFKDSIKDLAKEAWDAISNNENVALPARPFLNLTINDTGEFPFYLHSIRSRDELDSDDGLSKRSAALDDIVHAAK